MIWFLGLFFLTLLVGMTPMEVSAVLLTLAALYGMWKQKVQGKKFRIYFTGFDILFVVWLLIIFAGFAVNGIWDETLWLHLFEFKWILFLYLLTFVLVRTRPDDWVLP